MGRRKWLLIALCSPFVLLAPTWLLRWQLVRFDAMHIRMRVLRIAPVYAASGDPKPAFYGVILYDGTLCTSTDPSWGAIRPDNLVELTALPRVDGIPLVDPRWYECDRALLDRLVE